MNTKELIIREIEVFPELYLKEVLDFVRFLKDKSSKRGIEEAILSEPILAEEWLPPRRRKLGKICEGQCRRCALPVLKSRI